MSTSGGDGATEAEAEFLDGVAPQAHRVLARLAPPLLSLHRADGSVVAEWPVGVLRVVDRVRGLLRLAPESSDARLAVGDPAFVAAIEAALRPTRRAALRRRLRRAAIAAVAVPAVAFGLWQGWPVAADGIARATPEHLERSIGVAAVATLAGGTRTCDAPAGQAALDGLVAHLATAAGIASPVALRVLDDPAVNALAAPGGQIVVYRGLIEQAGSASEVAGVLAHELGHLRHRHGLRSVVRTAGLLVLAGALTGGSEVAGAAVVLVGLSHSREFEREADEEAARLLAATGIGTAGLVAFFERMERLHGVPGRLGRVAGYLGTHPPTGERAALLRAGAAATGGTAALSAAEWAAVRTICGGAGRETPRGTGAAVPTTGGDNRPLGTFGAWAAARQAVGTEGRFRCAMYSQPLDPSRPDEPAGARWSIWVLRYPHQDGREVVALGTTGQPLPAGASGGLNLAGRRFALQPGRDGRWLYARDPKGLAAALHQAAAEAGAVAVLTAPAATPEEPGITERFGLDGLSQAAAAIAQDCPPAPP